MISAPNCLMADVTGERLRGADAWPRPGQGEKIMLCFCVGVGPKQHPAHHHDQDGIRWRHRARKPALPDAEARPLQYEEQAVVKPPDHKSPARPVPQTAQEKKRLAGSNDYAPRKPGCRRAEYTGNRETTWTGEMCQRRQKSGWTGRCRGNQNFPETGSQTFFPCRRPCPSNRKKSK